MSPISPIGPLCPVPAPTPAFTTLPPVPVGYAYLHGSSWLFSLKTYSARAPTRAPVPLGSCLLPPAQLPQVRSPHVVLSDVGPFCGLRQLRTHSVALQAALSLSEVLGSDESSW